MAKLQSALAWAKRGYRVFPLAPDSRRPAEPGWDWSANASTDPEMIAFWWGTGDWNIGCCTGGGVVVVDLDQKNDQDGIGAYMEHGGTFGTLAVRTTTGGMHLYFAGDGRNSVGKVAPGIDLRGEGGYVVAPGSTIDGVAYELVSDKPLAPLPAWVAEAAQQRATVASSAPLTELDTPQALAGAALWLEGQRPAVEGQGGDAYTYQVACELRDRGVSAALTLDLLLEHWNERCLPPWMPDELRAKVENAFAYAQNPAGAKATAVLLGVGQAPLMIHEDEAPAAAATEDRDLSAFALGSIVPLANLPARPWLYRRFLMRGEITALAAAGAAGKSLVAITAAVHLALGRDWLGFHLNGGPQNSMLVNAEDNLAEMSRRLYALCFALGIDAALVIPRIALVSGKTKSAKIKLAKMGKDGPELVLEDVNALLNVCHHQQIVMLGIDPLVKMHSGLSENDSSHMDLPMEALSSIATEGNLAILLALHLAKPGIAGTAAYVGNADAIRGSSNIITSARAAFTLAGPTEDDVSRLNLTRDQRERLVRLDDAKMNLSLKSGEPAWLEKRTVLLPNGDEVGALLPADMSLRAEANRSVLARSLVAEMNARGVASMGLAEVTAIVKDLDPIYSKLTTAAVRTRLERFFMDDVPLGDGSALHLTPGKNRMITVVGE